MRTRGRVLLRGDYVMFTEYFHGEGAVGVMSIMDNRAAPGLTFMGGFGVTQDAHDVVTERHGFPPHLCDATVFYADPSALYIAGMVGAGAPCQGSSKKSRPRTCKVPPRRSLGGSLQVPRSTFREVARQDHAQGTSCTSYHKNFPTEK